MPRMPIEIAQRLEPWQQWAIVAIWGLSAIVPVALITLLGRRDPAVEVWKRRPRPKTYIEGGQR